MEPVSVKLANGNTMQIKNAEQIATLKEAGVLSEQDAANLQEQLKPKEQPKADEVKVSNQEATPEDQAKAEASRKAQADDAAKLANTKYFSEESTKLPGKESRGFMYGMTEAANKGDYKTAAEYYLKLEQSGVFAEGTGVKAPPFAEQMKDQVEAQRKEAQAQFQREAVAENVVRNVNSREGMEALVKTYEKMDEKKEVQASVDDGGLGIKHGAGKIAKNARKNSEHIQRQLNLNTVYVEGKTYNIDGKEMTADEAKKYQKEQLGDDWNKKQPQVQVMSKEGYAVAEKLNEKAKEMGVSILNEDGSIDIEKAQSVARGIVSIAGDRGDRNEMEAVAKELGVKEKDVKAFLRGLNVDYKKDKTWLAHTIGGVLGAGTAAGAYFSDFMTGGAVTKAISYIVPGAVNTAIDKTVTNNINEVTMTGPDGQKYYDKIESSVTSFTTTYTTTPDTVGTKDVKVKPKKGLGDALGALGMGYTVYDLSTKALKAVFNHDPNILKKGASLADALEDPTKLKKKQNQELMQYIKDFKLEGYDEATQKQIKLALMEEAMGNDGTGKLNDRELTGIAAALRSIPPKEEVQEEPVQEEPIHEEPIHEEPIQEEPVQEEFYTTDEKTSGSSVKLFPQRAGSPNALITSYKFKDADGNVHSFTEGQLMANKELYNAYKTQFRANCGPDTEHKGNYIYNNLDLGNGWTAIIEEDPDKVYENIGKWKSSGKGKDHKLQGRQGSRYHVGTQTDKDGKTNLGGTADDVRGKTQEEVEQQLRGKRVKNNGAL